MNRNTGRLGLAAVAILTYLSTPSSAHDYTVGKIKIVHPWTRMPPAAAKVAGGFMTLTNTGTETDRLIGGTAINAARFEVHEMSIVDGVMRMRQLQPGLEIKPSETVVLKPGSFHVMFMDLKGPPESGKRLKGTLVFEKAGTVDVEYKVEPADAKNSGAHEHGSHSSEPAKKGSGANASQ